MKLTSRFDDIFICFLIEQHTVQIGHDIKLTCEANGPSAPIIHWLHNEQLVKQVNTWHGNISKKQSHDSVIFPNSSIRHISTDENQFCQHSALMRSLLYLLIDKC